MREVLFRIRAWWVLFTLAGCALVGLPLLGAPGYELSTGLALLHGLLGGTFGVAFARRELRREPPAPRPVSRAVGLAFGALALALVPPFAVATAATLLFSRCDPFADVAFFPVLTLPSSLLAATSGAFLGFATRRWWTATLAQLGLVLASALATGWPLVFGPQVYAYNHFGGFLPGPLYDEALAVGAPLLWFRLATVALALTFWLACPGRPRTGAAGGQGPLTVRDGEPRAAPELGSGRAPGGPATRRLLALAPLLLFLVLELDGTALGFRMSDEVLAERLGGLRESEHVVLHYPRAMPSKDVERTLRDVEFRHQQLSAFLGGAPPGKVVVWWYASARDKQRLVGAAQTQFSKPWRREVHVNAGGFPHPVLKHELVHALAAPFGARPFGVAASWLGLYPNAGVIEGLAVAGDDPVDELSLHEWAAAMKRQRLLPDVRELLEPAGFYRQAPSRAYAAAGSFLRWLGDTRGGEKLRALYRAGDFQGVYGVPLAELATGWEAFLDTVPLDAEAVNQAFGRFKRGSLFERPCAREVARVAGEAHALAESDPAAALARLQRCREVQPDEPAHALAVAAKLRALQLGDQARALLDAELQRLEPSPTPWADAALARADLALAAGDEATARWLWAAIVALQVSPPMDRTARIRLAGLELPPASRAAVARYFEPGSDEVRSVALRDALAREPDQVLVAYLLGRRLQLAGASAEALPWLRQAVESQAPESVRREALRLAVEAAWAAGDCEAVRALAGQGVQFGGPFSRRLGDWVERCGFEAR